jgi:pimeloyl-ACP methyl ester carboxylesterase
MVADRYAEVLHDAGFAVLLYDHRNFGISDGEPRGEINPWIQARGYRDAIDFVSSLPEIDPSRVAIWGDSFSAGLVLVVGTCDDRVKAIVSQTTACGPTMPPPDPDGALFAAVKSTFRDADVSKPDLVTGPLPAFFIIRASSSTKPLALNATFLFDIFSESCAIGEFPGGGLLCALCGHGPISPLP